MTIPNRLIEQLEPYVGSFPDRGRCAAQIHAGMLGFGCVGRPLSLTLQGLGTHNFAIVDKKVYTPKSVASQCATAEVGRAKVSVAAELLGAATVTTFQSDISEVPHGIIRPDSIMIASFDNRFADAVANVMAIVMHSILIKVNIEPSQQAIAIRAYDFRSDVTNCVACGSRESDFQKQQNPRTCESAAGERPTNGPRPLAKAAGAVGAWAACAVAAGADEIFGKELLIQLDRQRLVVSKLPRRDPCFVDHRTDRPQPTYLRCSPADMTLRELLPPHRLSDVQLQFCHEVSTRSRCNDCRREFDDVHWIGHASQQVGSCTSCGGKLRPIPFWTFSTISAACLESVLDRRLSAWGVPPFAVLRVTAGHEDRCFVLTNANTQSKE